MEKKTIEAVFEYGLISIESLVTIEVVVFRYARSEGL